jgi:hypothetical protein
MTRTSGDRAQMDPAREFFRRGFDVTVAWQL